MNPSRICGMFAWSGSFQGIERDFLLQLEQLSELRRSRHQPRLHHLSDAFVEPVRAAAHRKLIHEGMGEFVFQHPKQGESDGVESLKWDAKLAIVKRAD